MLHVIVTKDILAWVTHGYKFTSLCMLFLKARQIVGIIIWLSLTRNFIQHYLMNCTSNTNVIRVIVDACDGYRSRAIEI